MSKKRKYSILGLPTQSGICSLGVQTPLLHCQNAADALYNWLPLGHVTVQNFVTPNELHDLLPPTGPSGGWHGGPVRKALSKIYPEFLRYGPNRNERRQELTRAQTLWSTCSGTPV